MAAKKKRKKSRRKNRAAAAPTRRRSNPSTRRRAHHHRRRRTYRRRSNPGGMGLALGAVALSCVAAGAIYGGLAFDSTMTANTKALVGAGVGLAGGLLVGMASPELGVGVAAGGAAVAVAQLASQEVATYTANQASSATSPTSTSAVNGPGDRPFALQNNPQAQLATARANLMRRGFR